MAGAEPDSEVHCLRTTMPSMSRLRKARAFFHDLPGRSGFGVPSGAPASQARVSFVTRENVERSFMVLREGHQLDRSDLQHVQVHVTAGCCCHATSQHAKFFLRCVCGPSFVCQ